MRNLTQSEVIARLAELERAVILFHVRPDGDAVGSAFALRRALALRGADVWCVCAHRLPDRLRFLCDTEGEQASVLPDALPERFADAPVITVDTASPAQMGDAAELFLPQIALMIDHHGSGEPYADHYILPDASATGEVLMPILAALCGGDELDPLVAARLFAAITSDTGCFKYSNASPATHRAAAALIENGMSVPADEINRLLFDRKTAGTLAAEQIALRNLRTFADGRVVVSTLSHDERISAGLMTEDTDTMIDAIRVLDGAQIACMLKQQEPHPNKPGVWRASLRSTGIDVAAIAACFGGGGHIRAAGCSITAETAEEAVEKIVGFCPTPCNGSFF